MPLTPEEEAELASLEADPSLADGASGGLTPAEQAELAQLQADPALQQANANVVPEPQLGSDGLPTPTGGDAATFNDTPQPSQVSSTQDPFNSMVNSVRGAGQVGVGLVAGAEKAALSDVPQAVTSGFGFFPNPVSQGFGKLGEQLTNEAKGAGAPDASIRIGEFAGAGGAGGGIMAMLGRVSKIKNAAVAAKATTKTGRVKKAVAKVLKEAGEKPVNTIAAETAAGGVVGASGEATDKALGKDAGLFFEGDARVATEVLTSLLAPSLLVAKLGAKYTLLDNAADESLARRLRDDPQTFVEAQASVGNYTKFGIEETLPILAKNDPVFAATAAKLGQLDAVRPIALQHMQDTKKVLADTIDKVTAGAMTPDEAATALDNVRKQGQAQMDNLLAQIPEGASDVRQASIDAWEGTVEAMDDAAGRVISKNYVDSFPETQTLLPDRGWGLLTALKAAKKEVGASNAELKASGLNAVSKEIAKDFGKDGKEKTGAWANSIRGVVLAKMRERRRLGKSTQGLNILSNKLTKYIEGFDHLKNANTYYSTYDKAFKKGATGKLLTDIKNNSATRKPSVFFDLITGKGAGDRAEELKRMIALSGEDAGVSFNDVRSFVREGFLAGLRDAEGNFSPTKLKALLANKNNVAALKTYGLTDDFKAIGTVKAASDAIADKFGKPALEKFALHKFGNTTGKLETLRSAIEGRTLEVVKQINDLPKSLQPAARRTFLKAGLFSDNLSESGSNILRTPAEINQTINNVGDAVGLSGKDKAAISRASSVIALGKVTDKSIPEFDRLFRESPDLFSKLKGILLERITRIPLKILRGATSATDFMSDKAVVASLQDALMTKEGAERILKLAREQPKMRSVLLAMTYGRAAYLQQLNGQPQGEQ